VHKAIRSGKFKFNSSLVTYLNPQSEIAEQYRTIRNNVRFASGQERAGTIVVTSPAVGDGKTVAAVSLSISMAQRGDRVLLIDTHVKRPMLHHIFNLQVSPGLRDVLVKQVELQEAVHKTDIRNLSILPCGQNLLYVSDLLDTEAMSVLLEQSLKQYDVVLLDSSPVVGSADACALASKCDGAILVVNGGKTQMQSALEAKRLLELGKVKVLGAILNN